MTQTLRVAGAQMAVTKDIAANAAAIARAIDFAAAEKADILLTPEGSLSGYTHEFDRAALDKALREVTARARQTGLALALGTCFSEATGGPCYNQIRFYDRTGRFLGFHAKILLCGSHEEKPRGEINHFASQPLRTFEIGGIAIGGLICNDLWANPCCTPMPDPHLTQQLARMGARIVFHAVNGGRNGSELSRISWQFQDSNLRMRALAGGLWIVTADNCDPATFPCSEPCGVVDPRGDWVCRTRAQGEHFFVYSVTIPR